jgi:hypothetical protein
VIAVVLPSGSVLSEFVGCFGEMKFEILPDLLVGWPALPFMAGMPVYLGALDEIECIGEDLVLVVWGLGVGSELHGILNLFVENFDGFVGIIFLAEVGIVAYNFGW